MTRAQLRLALVALVGLPLAAIVGVIVGGVLAGSLGDFGYNLSVLAVGALVSAVLARRTLPSRSLPLVPAFGVQGAHAVWLLSAVVVLRQWGGLLDVGALAGALVWLGARPTRRARNALLAVHGVELLLLLIQFARSSEPGVQLPWLVSHLALRAAGVALTLRALEVIWRALRASRPGGASPRP
jgi:hypothetical protein